MASVQPSWSISCERGAVPVLGISAFPMLVNRTTKSSDFLVKGRIVSQNSVLKRASNSQRKGFWSTRSKEVFLTMPRCSNSSNSNVSQDDSSKQGKVAFGYTRKDVLLLGVGLTVFGIVLKSGLEYVGVDPLQAGNVVQLVLVLGLTVGWISTYVFRVSNKEMTYAQQLRDYENKVMQKRLEGLTEAELEALLEEVEEEKRRLASDKQVN